MAVVAILARRPVIHASVEATRPAATPPKGAFNALTVRHIPPSAQEAREIALGELLFGDTRLSGDGKRSCVTCHDVTTNGASGRERDLTPQGQPLPVNTPTVFNAARNFRLNWSGNARTLESQARASLQNPSIMGADLTKVARVLAADAATAERFHDTYRRDPRPEDIVRALARYEATLITPGSRFDHYLMGEALALSAGEQRGYKLFQSVGCASCHQGVNVGGNLYQRSGVFHPAAKADSPVLRVPSLRNVATTAPYFHDGSAETLEDAVRAMGRAQLNRVLTADQVADIAAFLRSLNGVYRDRPVTQAAPR
ncbi:cytochrome-c peroxidase [Caulobacter segnis]|uniref:Cytochrome-c peroxidase n=3 Tax=Caulobacter segnis TaxID=88688 RepID=D5VLY6_CAUST|nr:Cytochrome-c peroxidase [Caulobacter segnis ATCC 21756]AVQ03168.1 cytochrome-c peroxidase [Caulobacter segnis]